MRRTLDETVRAYERVLSLINQGTSQQQALRQVKMGNVTYYKIKNGKMKKPDVAVNLPAVKEQRFKKIIAEPTMSISVDKKVFLIVTDAETARKIMGIHP